MMLFLLCALAACVGLALAAPTITEGVWPATTFLGRRDVVRIGEIQAFYHDVLPQAYAAATAGPGATGPPCGLYWTWDEAAGQTDIAAAVPLAGPMEAVLDGRGGAVPDGLELIEVPEGRGVTYDYFGPYGGLPDAHRTVQAYLAGRPFLLAVEEYLTDPSAEPDPARWHTRITYVLAEEAARA